MKGLPRLNILFPLITVIPLLFSACDICTNSGLVVEVYVPDKVYPGTTLLGDTHDPNNPRIIEVNMSGGIVWQYNINAEQLGIGAIEAELLGNNNIQATLSNGIFEISRGTDGNADGEIVWSYLTDKISHDADRLPGGRILYVFGHKDQKSDAQVTEIDMNGDVKWEWYAKDHYLDRFGSQGTTDGGWAHTNGVQRLENDSTLISMRNFYLTTVVDENGEIEWEYDWSEFGDDVDPHEPVLLSSGNLLVCLQNDSPYQAVEVNPRTEEIVWSYTHPSGLRTARDCDRLPNGNTLILAVQYDGPNERTYDGDDESTIIEVTPEGEMVWQLTLKGYAADLSPGFFFKAERIGAESTTD